MRIDVDPCRLVKSRSSPRLGARAQLELDLGRVKRCVPMTCVVHQGAELSILPFSTRRL